MTPSQVRVVRNTFKQVEPLLAQVGELFYLRLFEIAPDTRPLFGDNIAAQRDKFMQVVTEIVKLHMVSPLLLPVTRLEGESVTLRIQDLGRRHAAYGVREAHFGMAREAFLWTLERALTSQFTPLVREAWGAAFDMLARMMIHAMKGPEPLMDHSFTHRLGN